MGNKKTRTRFWATQGRVYARSEERNDVYAVDGGDTVSVLLEGMRGVCEIRVEGRSAWRARSRVERLACMHRLRPKPSHPSRPSLAPSVPPQPSSPPPPSPSPAPRAPSRR